MVHINTELSTLPEPSTDFKLSIKVVEVNETFIIVIASVVIISLAIIILRYFRSK